MRKRKKKGPRIQPYTIAIKTIPGRGSVWIIEKNIFWVWEEHGESSPLLLPVGAQDGEVIASGTMGDCESLVGTGWLLPLGNWLSVPSHAIRECSWIPGGFIAVTDLQVQRHKSSTFPHLSRERESSEQCMVSDLCPQLFCAKSIQEGKVFLRRNCCWSFVLKD